VVGGLFGSTSKEKVRTELVILIRPVVTWTPLEAKQVRERAQELMNMEPDLEATLYPRTLRPKVAPAPLDHPRNLSLESKEIVTRAAPAAATGKR
jgi:type II secretory pathway component GspD/PulD (secretin)